MELIALCDAATVSGGKLNVLGAFDTIQSSTFPVVHPQCALALRLRFSRLEEGRHRIGICITDADGRPILPPIDGALDVELTGDEESAAMNFVINIHQLKFENAGAFSINLSINDRHEASLPLFLKEKSSRES
ncbi:MAG: hypothetical protein FJ404_04655 [Verrucomicrobia bacterium]|nr:hypothetical protein [Verrucomicrobiota bacterium]